MSGGLYLYGVVPEGADPAIGVPAVGGVPERVSVTRIGPIGVLTSPHPTGEVLPRRRDLKAHARVLEAAACPLLPVRFGTVAQSPRALEETLLPRMEEILGLLDRFAGKAEYGVRIRVDRATLLSEVLEGSPALGRRHAAIAAKGEAGRYEMIELGRRIGDALEERRKGHQRRILAELQPLACRHVLRAPETDEEVLRADFLVERAREETMAERLDAIAGPIGAEVRLVGPAPVYSFVDLRIEFTG